MSFFTLDLETRSTNPNMVLHAALEPWRVRQRNAEIMSCDVYKPDGSTIQIVNTDSNFKFKLEALLRELKGQVVYCHNTVFDVAWIIATLTNDRCGPIPQVVKDIRWRDSMLLTKWLINGQKAEESKFSLSLANLVRTFLPNHPDTNDFIAMKSQGFNAGENADYWLQRGSLDVKMTWELVNSLQDKLPVAQRRGLMTEFDCIVPVANSWINGFKIDQKQLAENADYYSSLKSVIARKLNVSEAIFSSPKQLQKYLFTDLGLTPYSFTPSGSPGTSKGDLMWIEYNLKEAGSHDLAVVVRKIIEAKESATMMSKYVKTTQEALSHTGDGYIYSSPRLFGTYTGRMTYSNSVTHKDPDQESKTKFKTSIAMHQIPRKEKRVRKMILPPDDYHVLEFDAAGQESRLMALRSGDQTMIDIFSNDRNFHSMTGASIIGMDYDDFEDGRNNEKGEGYFTEARQRGKLTNLACNYRIGGKALASQAFEKYDVMIDIKTGNHLVKTFARTYSSVPEYWSDVIYESKMQGFTQEFGGRRYKLHKWANSDRFNTEQSAIMFPIQSAGASMKEIAICELSEKVPEFIFALDLHDASFGYVHKSNDVQEVFNKAERVLNNIDYAKYWGFNLAIPLPYDGVKGLNFSEVK